MATMTTMEFIKSRANVERFEFHDGYLCIYLTACEDADGKFYYTHDYIQTYICDILGNDWSVLTECNSDGDEIPVGICKMIKKIGG